MQSGCTECEATTRKLADQDAKIEELEMKARVLVDKEQQVHELQREMDFKVGDLYSASKGREVEDSASTAKAHGYSRLELKLRVVWAAIGIAERFLCALAGHACTGYKLLMCAWISNYRNFLNTFSEEERSRGEYRGRYAVCGGKDFQYLHLGEEGSEWEQSSHPKVLVVFSRLPHVWSLLGSAAYFLKYVCLTF